MPDYITLTCPSCGAKLEKTKGIGQFVCPYCGQEHILYREEEVVTLKSPVDDLKTDEIEQKQMTFDIVINQINREISELNSEKDRLLRKNPGQKSPAGFTIIIGATFLLLGLWTTITAFDIKALVLLICGIGLSILGIRETMKYQQAKTIWEEEIVPRVNQLAEQIQKKRSETQQLKNNEG